jgi:hypothetical protein
MKEHPFTFASRELPREAALAQFVMRCRFRRPRRQHSLRRVGPYHGISICPEGLACDPLRSEGEIPSSEACLHDSSGQIELFHNAGERHLIEHLPAACATLTAYENRVE